jgi:hypothetical protein
MALRWRLESTLGGLLGESNDLCKPPKLRYDYSALLLVSFLFLSLLFLLWFLFLLLLCSDRLGNIKGTFRERFFLDNVLQGGDHYLANI